LRSFRLLSALLLALGFVLVPLGTASAESTQTSTLVTWSCTGSPCPWGATDTGNAIAWPAEYQPGSSRFGYTTSAAVYAPAAAVAGIRVEVTSGSAKVYAGTPQGGGHTELAALSPGESFQVPDLSDGQVVSVQSGNAFGYMLEGRPQVAPQTFPSSELVTWSCTSSPCPWGATDTGHALVWPDDAAATSARLGYTADRPVYAPGGNVAGRTVTVKSGSATVYVGTPQGGAHSAVQSLSHGESYTIPSVGAGHVVSLQAGGAFSYTLTGPVPGQPEEPDEPEVPSDPSALPAVAHITLTCVGAPCPWGPTHNVYAAVWPDDLGPSSARLGYTASAAIYAPATSLAGASITVVDGTATLYSGAPDAASHTSLVHLSAGDTVAVPPRPDGDVISIQGSEPFEVAVVLDGTVAEACTDPMSCDVVDSQAAFWSCDIPGCESQPWIGHVISWPSEVAYTSNSRSGNNARKVGDVAGESLYPYMGEWADGCQVTAVQGSVLIIEWERGTDVWRETHLAEGQSHAIDLVSPENGAMIESPDAQPHPFKVALDDCTPAPVG
jgi:hypothetical protein